MDLFLYFLSCFAQWLIEWFIKAIKPKAKRSFAWKVLYCHWLVFAFVFWRYNGYALISHMQSHIYMMMIIEAKQKGVDKMLFLTKFGVESEIFSPTPSSFMKFLYKFLFMSIRCNVGCFTKISTSGTFTFTWNMLCDTYTAKKKVQKKNTK